MSGRPDTLHARKHSPGALEPPPPPSRQRRSSSRACWSAPRPRLLAVPGRATATPTPRDAAGRPVHLQPTAFPNYGG